MFTTLRRQTKGTFVGNKKFGGVMPFREMGGESASSNHLHYTFPGGESFKKQTKMELRNRYRRGGIPSTTGRACCGFQPVCIEPTCTADQSPTTASGQWYPELTLSSTVTSSWTALADGPLPFRREVLALLRDFTMKIKAAAGGNFRRRDRL